MGREGRGLRLRPQAPRLGGPQEVSGWRDRSSELCLEGTVSLAAVELGAGQVRSHVPVL